MSNFVGDIEVDYNSYNFTNQSLEFNQSYTNHVYGLENHGKDFLYENGLKMFSVVLISAIGSAALMSLYLYCFGSNHGYQRIADRVADVEQGNVRLQLILTPR